MCLLTNWVLHRPPKAQEYGEGRTPQYILYVEDCALPTIGLFLGREMRVLVWYNFKSF